MRGHGCCPLCPPRSFRRLPRGTIGPVPRPSPSTICLTFLFCGLSMITDHKARGVSKELPPCQSIISIKHSQTVEHSSEIQQKSCMNTLTKSFNPMIKEVRKRASPTASAASASIPRTALSSATSARCS